jgi:hypothetical protein
MSNVSYRLYNKEGRRISKDNVAKAASFDVIFDKKVVSSIDFPKSYKKADKVYEIEAFLHDVEISLEILRQEKARIRKEKLKAKKLLEQENLRLQKEFKKQQELERLLREDIKALMAEEAKLTRDQRRQEREEERRRKEEEELITAEERKQIKEAKKEIRKEADKLKRTVKGRLRLWLKEQLAERVYFWDDQKVEDFVDALERAYGVEIKSIKDRASETNFKKFITKAVHTLEHHDSRQKLTADQLMRSVIKRMEYESRLMEQEKFEGGQSPEDINYSLVEEKFKYYYSKSSGKNTTTKQFVYEFDPQIDVTSKAIDAQVMEDTYEAISEAIRKETTSLYKKGIIGLGKNFQVRLLIPQYDEAGDIQYEYVGGNGSKMGRRDADGKVQKNENGYGKKGYGISIQSQEFSLSALEDLLGDEGLITLTKDRLNSYLKRNVGFIYSQYISGFMIIVEV